MAKRQGLQRTFPILTEELDVGMHISIPASLWLKHPFIVPRFVIEDEDTIRILLRCGITEVVVDPAKSRVPKHRKKAPALCPVETSAEQVQEKLEMLLEKKDAVRSQAKERRAKFRRALEFHVGVIRNADEIEKMLLAGAPGESIQDTINQVWPKTYADYRELSPNINVSIVNNADKTLPYHHGVNTASLSMMLAIDLGFNTEKDLKLIGVASLVHDIGLNALPSLIRYPRKTRSKTEWNKRKEHIEEGLKILERANIFDPEILEIVRYHHEHVNGQGYYGKTGDEMSPHVKIVQICNYYDRQINHPIPSEQLTPHETIKEMWTLFRERFELSYLSAFINTMGLFPAGSYVKLSNDRIGCVTSTYKDDMMNPEVLLYDPDIDPSEAIFYRLKELGEDVRIVKNLYPHSLAESIRRHLNYSETVNYSVL